MTAFATYEALFRSVRNAEAGPGIRVDTQQGTAGNTATISLRVQPVGGGILFNSVGEAYVDAAASGTPQALPNTLCARNDQASANFFQVGCTQVLATLLNAATAVTVGSGGPLGTFQARQLGPGSLPTVPGEWNLSQTFGFTWFDNTTGQRRLHVRQMLPQAELASTGDVTLNSDTTALIGCGPDVRMAYLPVNAAVGARISISVYDVGNGAEHVMVDTNDSTFRILPDQTQTIEMVPGASTTLVFLGEVPQMGIGQFWHREHR